MAEGFRVATAFVQVSPDTTGFREELKDKLDEATAGIEGKVKVTLDTSELDAKADEARAKVDELDGSMAEPSVRLDSGDLDAKADEARAKLDELDGKSARPDVGLSAADLDARVDEAKAKLDELDAKRADPILGLDSSDFDAKMDAAEARLDAFKAKSASAGIGASGSSGGHAGGGEGGFAGAIAMGIGSLMPGLGGAAAGLGLLGATGAMALGPVAKALSAAHQASLNVGLTPQELASTRFSNTVQNEQAGNTVTMAREQAGQDAVTSAASIQQAEMNLASVTRNAAEQQVQALQSVKAAEQGVEEANYGLSEAQYNLTQAWEQAREQIKQLDDQLADSKLNVQQAQLAIKQALYNQRLVDQNAYSTALDRQQAALSVVQAQQQLKDASDQETDAAYQANLVNKQGVAGTQLVIQAKQGVTQATYQQTDANKQLQIAQQQATLTEENNATQIREAQIQVQMAREQAAYQAKIDAQQVAIAERNVTNTIREQQLQMAATKSTSNEAANQFIKDMSRMSPAGRAMVNQILGMKGAFKGLETAAQNAVFPGFTLALKGLQKLLPDIHGGVSRMGGAISKAFAALGKGMATPAAAHVLDGLIANGVRFAKIVVPAFGAFVGELAKIGSKKGAADGLANLLAGIGRGLTGLAATVGKNTGPINQFLSAVGVVIARIGPPLGTIIGLVARALEPLTRYLNAHPNGTLAKTLGGIVAGLLTIKSLVKWAKAPFEAISKGYEMVKKIPDKLSGAFTKVFGRGGIFDDLRLRGMYAAEGINKAFLRTRLFFTQTLPEALSTAGTKLSGFASSGMTAIGNLGSKIGSAMSSAASAVSSFVATFGQKLAAAAVATGTWIAEQTTAAFTFISENLAEAAAATTAFFAENLATLGIVAGIALLIAGIVLLATHWKQVWADIEAAALWLWHNVLDPMWHGIEAGASWLYQNVLLPMGHWFRSMFDDIKQYASDFVHAFESIWNKLEGVFKTPVNFLINTVYDNGIAKLWNAVVDHVGLKSLALKPITGFATGGVVPGYSPGRDTVPAMLSPGEGVLVPEAVRAIGPGTVHSLNSAYGGGRKSSVGHYAGGGIIGDVVHGVSAGISKAADIAKIAAALATGNGAALTNALGKLVSTNALGDYAKVMVSLPKTLISDAVQKIVSMVGGGGGGANGVSVPGAVSGSVAQWFAKAVKLTGVGSAWIPDLETIAHYESGDNPNAINLTDSNAAAGDPSRGIMQTIMTTFDAYHQTGTSSNIYDPVANIAAAINYIKSRYGTVANVPGIRSLASGGGYVGYDSGGWLMPGGMPGVNHLGKPEAVLTPQESEAFVAIVRQLTARGVGGGSPLGGGPTVVQNYQGTQWPTAEQKASMLRDLGLALGGAS